MNYKIHYFLLFYKELNSVPMLRFNLIVSFCFALRVKEAIAKKDETLRLVQKQRDAALEQCCQLENMLEQQRKEYAHRKSS